MNTSVMFSSRYQAWDTPQEYFDIINKEFNFDIDVCATKENSKCLHYFTPEQNSLDVDWYECGIINWDKAPVCFMNPPYGRQIGLWVHKAYEESKKGCKVVCLLPARTDTKWFHDYCKKGEIRFIKGRLVFGSNEYWNCLWEQEFIDGKKNTLYKTNKKNSAPFPSMLVIFN